MSTEALDRITENGNAFSALQKKLADELIPYFIPYFLYEALVVNKPSDVNWVPVYSYTRGSAIRTVFEAPPRVENIFFKSRKREDREDKNIDIPFPWTYFANEVQYTITSATKMVGKGTTKKYYEDDIVILFSSPGGAHGPMRFGWLDNPITKAKQNLHCPHFPNIDPGDHRICMTLSGATAKITLSVKVDRKTGEIVNLKFLDNIEEGTIAALVYALATPLFEFKATSFNQSMGDTHMDIAALGRYGLKKIPEGLTDSGADMANRMKAFGTIPVEDLVAAVNVDNGTVMRGHETPNQGFWMAPAKDEILSMRKPKRPPEHVISILESIFIGVNDEEKDIKPKVVKPKAPKAKKKVHKKTS
jgi:hypothetical protein